MRKYGKFFKIILTILTLGYTVWFGGSIVRTAIGYDLFKPEATLQLKPEYTDAIRFNTVYLYTATSLYTDIGYAVAFIAMVIIAFYMRKDMVKRGWIFMAMVLFFIAAPMQWVSIWHDIQLSIAIIYNHVNTFAAPEIQQHFMNRFTSVLMTTGTGIAFLANITCLLYAVWRPLETKTISE